MAISVLSRMFSRATHAIKVVQPLVRSIRTVTFNEVVLDLTLLNALLFFSVAQKEVQNGKYL